MEVQHTAKNCVPGRPFTKGGDPRRNTRGRPKTFDMLREIAQRIGGEKIQDANGETIMRVEEVLRRLACSKDPQALRIFLEYGFGRPVDRVELEELPKNRLILRFAHEADRELSSFDCVPPNIAREMQRRLKGPEAPNGEGTCSRPLLSDSAD